MTLKWQEVGAALFVVLALVVAKHVPALAGLQLARITGIFCFGYAVFLSLRLIEAPEAVSVGGWSELRPSAVEKLGAGVLAGFSCLIVAHELFSGSLGTVAQQRLFTLTLAAIFGAGAIVIALTSLFVEVRWNARSVERRSSLGRRTVIAWSEVTGVEAGWQAITIRARSGRTLRFSAYGAGAAELLARAQSSARRNAGA